MDKERPSDFLSRPALSVEGEDRDTVEYEVLSPKGTVLEHGVASYSTFQYSDGVEIRLRGVEVPTCGQLRILGTNARVPRLADG